MVSSSTLRNSPLLKKLSISQALKSPPQPFAPAHKFWKRSKDFPNPAPSLTNWLSTQTEDAVEKLHTLTSNADAIEKVIRSKATTAELAIPKMKKYLQRIGLDSNDLNKLSVIHVSGTKGKGSTCAFSERILSCHGYTTGLYTSPHLFEVRERIRINGRPLSKEKFGKYFWSVFSKLKDTEIPCKADEGYDMPFYFTFLTVMAIHVFLEEGVDVAIMEVGIGGQYDPTNVFERPVVCGVTALGFDHTNILGNTIQEIAWNKAGIFKRDRPAVVLPQDPSAMQVILDRAVERQSPLFVSESLSRHDLNNLHVNLGIDCDKQAENGCLAVHLTDLWMRLHKREAQMQKYVPATFSNIEDIASLKIRDLHEATVEGLSTCVWPGRTQTIKRERTTYYLDGAHTRESIEVCAKWFKEKANMEKMHLGGTVIRLLIFNTTGDRDTRLFLSLLKDCDFDVALFCTNQLSTVESLSKSDRYYNTFSWKKMMEKARSNQAVWDNLTPSPSSVSPDRTAESCGRPSQDKSFLTSPSSQAFPCILHALAWATQGRDSNVKVKDHRGVDLPEAPQFLQKAEHVQILITGSLHLVGGALEVLIPDMNS
ncbi:folylpolyglutamate synthase [Plakobranchus ocellatus]|uniref:Folylpolyglutamate synthase n=1 Tax=Plakobranchus ocellatus TaxID=259542 RepID=A0AAV3ZFC2_9GAST|nr:folylpolyglutamate synthase [Plakobranchus ocellatus]